jgi:hypothetical protein
VRERSERDSVTDLRRRDAHMITDPLVFNFFTQPKQQVNHLMNHSKNLIIASHRMNQKKREEYFMNQNINSIRDY